MKPEESIAITGKIVEILGPYDSGERLRVIRAALLLLVDTASSTAAEDVSLGGNTDDLEGYSPKAKLWMKKYGITSDQLQQVFHIKDGHADVISGAVPGGNKKVQALNAYTLTGIGNLLANGEPAFDDRSARSLCESLGCYDSPNHASTLKDRGDKFTGSKEKGWILTAPGLKHGADLVKELGG